MPSSDLRDLRIYQLSMQLGEDVWALVAEWPSFAKQTMAGQAVRAADSIAANISEGFGRYSFKENARFCYYARGSLRETATWLEKAHSRRLVTDERLAALSGLIDSLRRQLDSYIRSIGQVPGDASVLREDAPAYGTDNLPPLEQFLSHLDTLLLTPAP